MKTTILPARAETRSLDDVITAARALVHYALNLFRQKHAG